MLSSVCVYEYIITIIISVVGFLVFLGFFVCLFFSERLLNTITSRQHNESKCMDLELAAASTPFANLSVPRKSRVNI